MVTKGHQIQKSFAWKHVSGLVFNVYALPIMYIWCSSPDIFCSTCRPRLPFTKAAIPAHNVDSLHRLYITALACPRVMPPKQELSIITKGPRPVMSAHNLHIFPLVTITKDRSTQLTVQRQPPPAPAERAISVAVLAREKALIAS